MKTNYAKRVRRVRAALGDTYPHVLRLAEYLDKDLPYLDAELGDAEMDLIHYDDRFFDCRLTGHWWSRIPYEGAFPIGSGLPPEQYQCSRCEMVRVDVIAVGGWVQRRMYDQPSGYRLSAERPLYRNDFKLINRERELDQLLSILERHESA